ncbi:MAG: hypothetical protein P0Y53_04895 [Candidatus Pseudobacter hemicellulosilyticus]|uniref:Uncharacterized protein n=1 Tax=Candidatus Pseudobacter hemicellulosilyticus TaxID=3121375 RepID=A0AAJ6BI24_9BACT|nr:MAG: hypothetical protein P0Y53_04895 [Pseudobacter sp.]
MKKQSFFLPVLLCFFLFQAARAQEAPVSNNPQNSVPRWVCDKAYWVVRSSKQEPQQHTVYFYTNSHQLFYTEELTGVKLHFDRTRTKMRLKHALEESLLHWESKGMVGTNQGYVSRQLKIAPVPAAGILVDKNPVSGDNPPSTVATPF